MNAPLPARDLVFLHLPKTGGQTIHHAIAAIVGGRSVSPVRVNRQAVDGRNFPPGFRFHSGHLDWVDLETLPGRPFVFTVLRDPRERLGSFYFYMREKAAALRAANADAPLSADQARILTPPDHFFFPGEGPESLRIRRIWANLATTYLASRRLDGRASLDAFDRRAVVDMAIANADRLDGLYRFGAFDALERDIEHLTGLRPNIADKRSNPGPLDVTQSRWNALTDAFETDRARRAIEGFVAEDIDLMDRIRFRSLTG